MGNCKKPLLESGRGARGGACDVLAFLGGFGSVFCCGFWWLGFLSLLATPGRWGTGGCYSRFLVLAVLKQKKGKGGFSMIDVLGRVKLSSSVSAKSFGEMNFHLQPMN
ncbi:hypothetical protein MTP99_004782 [Tenebrio molitor]|nr:hypothetical protein MTP99_004782 [Tenebrio molitor]